MTKQTLIERINSVNGSTGSASIAELLEATKAEIETESSTAEAKHGEAPDLGCSDLAAAEAAARAAELQRDRLVLALPRLEDKFTEAYTAERHAKWYADYLRVEEAHDALGQEFADVYRGLSVQLADL